MTPKEKETKILDIMDFLNMKCLNHIDYLFKLTNQELTWLMINIGRRIDDLNNEKEQALKEQAKEYNEMIMKAPLGLKDKTILINLIDKLTPAK